MKVLHLAGLAAVLAAAVSAPVAARFVGQQPECQAPAYHQPYYGGFGMRGAPKTLPSGAGCYRNGPVKVFPLPSNMRRPNILVDENIRAGLSRADETCMARIGMMDMRRRLTCLGKVDVMLEKVEYEDEHEILVEQVEEYLGNNSAEPERSDVQAAREILKNRPLPPAPVVKSSNRAKTPVESKDVAQTVYPVAKNRPEPVELLIEEEPEELVPVIEEWIEVEEKPAAPLPVVAPAAAAAVPAVKAPAKEKAPAKKAEKAPAKKTETKPKKEKEPAKAAAKTEKCPACPECAPATCPAVGALRVEPVSDLLPEEDPEVKASIEARDVRAKEDAVVDRGYVGVKEIDASGWDCQPRVCEAQTKGASADYLTDIEDAARATLASRTADLGARLSAVCTMKCVAVADDSREERITHELAAYVRRRVPWSVEADSKANPPIRPVRPDVQAALYAITGADRSKDMAREIDLQGSDLRGADLEFANLAGVNLSGSNLKATNLGSATGLDDWFKIYLITLDETSRIPDSVSAGFVPTKAPYIPPQEVGSYKVIADEDWIWWTSTPVTDGKASAVRPKSSAVAVSAPAPKKAAASAPVITPAPAPTVKVETPKTLVDTAKLEADAKAINDDAAKLEADIKAAKAKAAADAQAKADAAAKAKEAEITAAVEKAKAKAAADAAKADEAKAAAAKASAAKVEEVREAVKEVVPSKPIIIEDAAPPMTLIPQASAPKAAPAASAKINSDSVLLIDDDDGMVIEFDGK
ncbi:hypothetical protein FACS1894186_6230 [Alphaproteobacteria bacterium]|nr:hypothetical protein FACS1894186_6230 [Alphaproteobacteria bacterium]